MNLKPFEAPGHFFAYLRFGLSAYDQISGTAWDEFLRYAKERPGAAFRRKDEIVHYSSRSPLTLSESEVHFDLAQFSAIGHSHGYRLGLDLRNRG
jgi:hypothetical protein